MRLPGSSLARTGAGALLAPLTVRHSGGTDMHKADSIPVRDGAGNVLGHIDTMQNGDQVLRNAQDEIRGYYDAKGDFTRDAQQNIVAKGNKLRSMIC